MRSQNLIALLALPVLLSALAARRWLSAIGRGPRMRTRRLPVLRFVRLCADSRRLHGRLQYPTGQLSRRGQRLLPEQHEARYGAIRVWRTAEGIFGRSCHAASGHTYALQRFQDGNHARRHLSGTERRQSAS